MTFDPNNPKYTALVLGELDGTERAAVQAELHSDPQVAALVTEIRAATDQIAMALKSESLPALIASQREAVLVAPASKLSIKSAADRRRLWTATIAASALIVISAAWLLRTHEDHQLATSFQASLRREPTQQVQPVHDEVLDLNSDQKSKLAQNQVSNQMKQIGLGLQNDEDKRNSLAPALQTDSNSTSLHDSYGFAAPGREGINGAFRDSYSRNGWNGQGSGQFSNSDSHMTIPAPSTPLTAGYYGAKNAPVDSLRARYSKESVAPGTTARGTNSGDDVFFSTSPSDPRAKELQEKRNWAITNPANTDGKTILFGSNNYSGATTVQNGTLTTNQLPAVEMLQRGQQQGGQLTLSGTSNFSIQLNGKGFGDGRDVNEREGNTEAYDYLVDNAFLAAAENPLSTFSIDVDTASYSNIRRFLLQQNQLPPPGAVRIEELINYFRYSYPQPEGDRPFSVTTEVASCPWASDHRLVRIGLKGKEIAKDKRPPSNLVFLVDVSGSMEQPNKLPLVQQSLKLLTQQLGENDHVAIVVYAGHSGLVLPSTSGDRREEIIEAIDRLRAGGSTNGGQGIELAYEVACQSLIKGGVNRVILATDGDFNVGITNQDALVRLIEEKAKTGVFLTTLGFGYGNIKDSTMQKLADKGNGSNFYIDDLPEAKKVLVEQIGGTLVTIAKDVKIQVEFNPTEVASYRLIGYEKRILAKEDFNDDAKDAGEIGAGHTVTALYEIVPTTVPGGTSTPAATGVDAPAPATDPLKYQQPGAASNAAKSGEMLTLKLRYKLPDGDKSTLMETPIKDSGKKYREASADFKFAAAVASFGMILRHSQYAGNTSLAAVEELAQEGVAHDGDSADASYRAEFVQIVDKAKSLVGH